MLRMHKLEPEEQERKVYNSVQRIQELMWLETNHIDKPELVRQAGIPKGERSHGTKRREIQWHIKERSHGMNPRQLGPKHK